MAIYLRVRKNNVYKISNGKCVAINTETKMIKQTENLPSGKMIDVEVISENIYKLELKKLNLI